jgi:hypothetical protein
MSAPTIPQISIFLDSAGNFRAEAPGLNGARRKVDLPLDFASANPEITSELYAQRDQARERDAARLRQLQLENVKYVSENHHNLVQKIWHNGELVFSRSLKRALRDTNLANTTQSGATVAKTPREKRAADPNLAVEIDVDDLDL